MKKLFLLLLTSALPFIMFGQQKANSISDNASLSGAVQQKMISGGQRLVPGMPSIVPKAEMDQMHKNSFIAREHSGHSSKKTTVTSSYSDWYDIWDQNTYIGGPETLYYQIIYPDSTLINDYAPPTSYVFGHGMGMSFDPTDSAYSINALSTSVSKAMPLTGQAYVIDSYFAPIRYVRNNTAPTVHDSLVIEIFVTVNLAIASTNDSGTYNFTWNTPSPSFYPFTYDETPRWADVRYNSGINAPYNVAPYINDCYYDSVYTRKYRYVIPLTNTALDTDAYGLLNLNHAAHLEALPLSPAININASNTHAVSYISFKSGVSYTLGTHSSAANYLICYTGAPLGSTTFMQSCSNPSLSPAYPGSFQNALLATNENRYTDPSTSLYFYNDHNILFPGSAYYPTTVNNVTLDQWHVTWSCTTPTVGAILGGATTICVGSTYTFSDATSGGVWSTAFGNASATTGGSVFGATAGVDTIIYTVTNSCGSTRAIQTVTVLGAPSPAAITGPTAVCPGATINLSDATSGGVWSSSSTTLATITSGGVVTGRASGPVSIGYKVTNACGSTIVPYSITVSSLPNAGSLAGATTSVCVGNTITLTNAVSGGTWSTVIGDATVIGGVVTGAIAGVDTVKYAVSNSCGTAVADTAVTVNPLPVPLITTSGMTLSTAVTYTSYQWLLSGANIFGATSYTFTAITSGAYSVVVTDTNGCTGTSSVTMVTNGVQNINALYNVNIYPNPTTSIVNIGSTYNSNFNVQLTAMDGRVVMDKYNVKQIDIANLPNGNYIITVFETNTSRKVITQRLVKSAN